MFLCNQITIDQFDICAKGRSTKNLKPGKRYYIEEYRKVAAYTSVYVGKFSHKLGAYYFFY